MNKKPLPILAAGWILIAMPIINVIGTKLFKNIAVTDFQTAIELWSPIGFAFLATAPLVGIAVLVLRRVAFYTFITYAALLIVYNLYTMVSSGGIYNITALVQTALFFSLLGYFLRKDSSAPLLSQEERGWRGGKRFQMAINVELNGSEYVTKDISANGMYLNWTECKLTADQAINFVLNFNGEKITCKGTVVRVTDIGVAVRFVDLDKTSSQQILKNIKKAHAQRGEEKEEDKSSPAQKVA